MYSFYIILGIILWLAVLTWAARVASRKGYSFILFFLLTLPLPIITLIIAYALPDKTKTAPAPAAE